MSPLKAAVFLSLALLGGLAQAGSWMRSEGEHRYAATVHHSTSNSSWDRDGRRSSSSCRSQNWTLSQAYEYGYSYYYTLFGDLALGDYQCGSDGVSGVGDLELGIRGRLDLYRNGRSWEAALTLPTGYDRDRPVRLGYGRFAVRLGLAIRERIDADSAWEYGAGVRFWQGPPAHQLLGYVKWTERLAERWELTGKLDGRFALGSGDEENIAFLNRDRLAEFDVIEAGVEVKHRLENQWKVSLGLSRDIWGRNHSRGTGAYLGISRVWGR